MDNKEIDINNEIPHEETIEKKPLRSPKPSTKKAPAKKSAKVPKKKTVDPVDLNELVQVVSCTCGIVDYISSMGLNVRWENFGDVAWMTVKDLMDMRNHQRDFFERQWICLEGDNAKAVMEYLQIDKYYKGFNSPSGLDKIFEYDPLDIPEVLSKVGSDIRETIASRAYEKIQSGELDSNRMIRALEEALGRNLTDPQ